MKPSPFQIGAHRLASLSFDINDKYQPPKDGKTQLVFKNDIKVKRYNKDRLAEVTFTLTLFEPEKPEASPFTAKMMYQGLFKWDEKVTEEELGTYLQVNAPAVLFSYIRPIVTQLTVQAGFPPLNLPMMDFRKEEKK